MFGKRQRRPIWVKPEIRRITRDPLLAWANGAWVQAAPIELADQNVIDTTSRQEGVLGLTRAHLCWLSEGGVESNVQQISNIVNASWEPESKILSVVFATASPGWNVLVPEDASKLFLAALRERVESTVLLRREISLAQAEKVHLAVRTDAHGEPFIQIVAPHGVDLSDPRVREKLEPAVRRLREVSGAR